MGCLLAIAAFAIGTRGGWAANLTAITIIANIGFIWSLIWTFVVAPVGWWWGGQARTVPSLHGPGSHRPADTA
jgi:hypothetical protein